MNVAKTNKAAFLERYQIDFRSETTVEGALARDLFVAVAVVRLGVQPGELPS